MGETTSAPQQIRLVRSRDGRALPLVVSDVKVLRWNDRGSAFQRRHAVTRSFSWKWVLIRSHNPGTWVRPEVEGEKVSVFKRLPPVWRLRDVLKNKCYISFLERPFSLNFHSFWVVCLEFFLHKMSSINYKQANIQLNCHLKKKNLQIP